MSVKERWHFPGSAFVGTGRNDCPAGSEEITERLTFLVNVGLDYLTLDRQTGTLSGVRRSGSACHQIGSGLVGVLISWMNRVSVCTSATTGGCLMPYCTCAIWGTP